MSTPPSSCCKDCVGKYIQCVQQATNGQAYDQCGVTANWCSLMCLPDACNHFPTVVMENSISSKEEAQKPKPRKLL